MPNPAINRPSQETRNKEQRRIAREQHLDQDKRRHHHNDGRQTQEEYTTAFTFPTFSPPIEEIFVAPTSIPATPSPAISIPIVIQTPIAPHQLQAAAPKVTQAPTAPHAVAASSQQKQTAPSVNPEFDALYAEMIKFPESYKERRKQLDSQRFFSRFRPETNTPERVAAAALIHTMAELIKAKRSIIEIETKDPSIPVSGLDAVLEVQLKKIDDSYKNSFKITQYLAPIQNTALAPLMLRVLKVDSFDKIAPAKFRADLEAIKKCLTIIEKEQEIEDKDIIKFIGDVDKCLEPFWLAEPEAKPALAPAMS